MNTAEAAALSTQGFIDENPTELVLTRSQRERTSAGGLRAAAPVELPAIQARMVAGGDLPARLDVDGEQVLPNYRLVALPATDVQRFDEFQWNGMTCRVVWVQTEPEWAVRAEVIARG